MKQRYRLLIIAESISLIVGVVLAFAKYQLLGFIIIACSLVFLSITVLRR
jgi:hypothetical protein